VNVQTRFSNAHKVQFAGEGVGVGTGRVSQRLARPGAGSPKKEIEHLKSPVRMPVANPAPSAPKRTSRVSGMLQVVFSFAQNAHAAV
jgi:hypothetical protein